VIINTLKKSQIHLLIGLYALFLILYFYAFNTKLHLSTDLFENYVWGQTWSWGNDKHPPLVSWIAHLWFSIFPTSISSYFYLVTLNMVISLWFLFKAMEYFFDKEQILIAIILTALITSFNTHSGLKYNCNLAQLPFITGFFLAFAKAMNTNQIKYYLYAGLFCGLGLLTKYTYILIVAPYALLLLYQYRKSLSIPGLIATSVVTTTLFLPHIIWEIRHAWPSLEYAASKIPMDKKGLIVNNFRGALTIFSSMVISLAVLAISYLQVFNKTPKCPTETSSPRIQIKLGAPTLMISLLLMFLIANLKEVKIDHSWLIANCILSGWAIVDLMPRSIHFEYLSRQLRTNFLIYLFVTLLIAFHTSKSLPLSDSHMILKMSDDVTQYFESDLKRPLDYVGGDKDFAYGLSFYSRLHPKGFTGFSAQNIPWIDKADLKRSNFVIICRDLSSSTCQQKTSEVWGKPDEIKFYEYSYINKRSHKQTNEPFSVLIYLKRKY
jgi:4-amino-4-deoxy-L-arabinose transferase-like glycosyltransferase